MDQFQKNRKPASTSELLTSVLESALGLACPLRFDCKFNISPVRCRNMRWLPLVRSNRNPKPSANRQVVQVALPNGASRRVNLKLIAGLEKPVAQARASRSKRKRGD